MDWNLLAQAKEATEVSPDALLETIGTLFKNYGTQGGLLAILIFFVFKYGPRMAEAHLTFLQAQSKYMRRSTAMQRQFLKQMDVLKTSVDGKHEEHHRTHDAIVKGTHALEALAHGQPKEAEIKEHMRAIREGLAK